MLGIAIVAGALMLMMPRAAIAFADNRPQPPPCPLAEALNGIPTPKEGWYVQAAIGDCVPAEEWAKAAGLPALAGPARLHNFLQVMGERAQYQAACFTDGSGKAATVSWGDQRSLDMFLARPWDRPYHYRMFFSDKAACEALRTRTSW